MYPALSSVHTNTFNFVHIDSGILRSAFFFSIFLYLSFAFFRTAYPVFSSLHTLSFTSIVIKTKKVDFVSY